MGRTMRRVTEAVLQGLHFFGAPTDKSFQPTSNCRNEAMLKEAAAFSLHIRTLERDLRAMEKQMTGQFANLRDIMITPLPKVYDRLNEDGEVVAREDPSVPSHLSTIGQCMNYDRLTEAMDGLGGCLKEEVYQPMHEWLKEFKRVQGEMKILEALRLELDSRKRTVAGLDRKLTLQTAKSRRHDNGAPLRMFGSARYGGGIEPQLDVIEKTAQRKAKKEESRRANQSNFDKLELETFARLEILILDASSLRDYAATSLLIIRECFSTALTAFEAQRPGTGTTLAPPLGMAPAIALAAAIQANPASERSAATATQSSAAFTAHDQSGPYDQSGGFDAVPQGKLTPPPPPPADAAPRHYIRQAAAATPPKLNARPSGRFIHAM